VHANREIFSVATVFRMEIAVDVALNYSTTLYLKLSSGFIKYMDVYCAQ
jgi:hypothetical protein